MSISFYVYGVCQLNVGEMAGLADGIAGLRAVVSGDVVQVFDANNWLCCDVSEAVSVNREDIGFDTGLKSDSLWLVTVDTKTNVDALLTDQFVKVLAKAMRGVAYDDSFDQLWPLPEQAKPPVRREEKLVRRLTLEWFGRWQEGDPPLPGLLLGIVGKWFREALPRRYGDVGGYPLGQRFSDGGIAAMDTRWREAADDNLAFGLRCSGFPFTDGAMSTLAGVRAAGGFWHMSLMAVADVFQDEKLRDRLRGLFTELADSSAAVYAYAEVNRGYRWDGHDLIGRVLEAERSPGVWGMNSGWGRKVFGLFGLTSYPTWWAWFGGSYLSFLQEYLTRPPKTWKITPTRKGVLAELADRPACQAELWGPVSRRLHLGWVPASLVSRKRRLARIRPEQ